MTAYIFKSSLSLIFLFGLYWFLLRKEKLFVFNRYFLVLSVLFSLILPLISITVNFRTLPELQDIIPTHDYFSPQIITPEESYSQDINNNQQIVVNQPSGIDMSTILVVLYLVVVIFLLIRFLRNICLICNRIKVSDEISLEGYRVILTDENTNPYCFFNSIFLSRNDYMNGRIDKELLKHEMEHARQSHTFDIIFIELVKIFYWFNPVNLLYEKAIRINHEYLADNGVIIADHDIKNYADILIGYITGMKNIPLTSGINHSFTKKRLLMMVKTKSNSFIYGLRIAIVLVLFIVLSLFMSFKRSVEFSSGREDHINVSAGSQTQTLKDIEGNVYKTVIIGNTVWMAENLRTTRYNDGQSIPYAGSDELWQKYEPAYCWYNNDEAGNKNEYGALYNWYAVNTGKLCPEGWHVPGKKELAESIKLFDTITAARLKSTGIAHWKVPDKKANNETGFSALPGGFRWYKGEFIGKGESACWWTSSEENDYVGFGWTINSYNSRVGPAVPSKRSGYSVRCIRDHSQNASGNPVVTEGFIQNSVRGMIMTEDGKPLSRAMVIATKDNLPFRVGTGFDGRFNLFDLNQGDSIYVECRGFKRQTLKADFSSEMVIRLAGDPDYKGKIVMTEIKEVNFRNHEFAPTNSLVVINGSIMDYNGRLFMDPGLIRTFRILKEDEAVAKYGEKGKDGVVEIRLHGGKDELKQGSDTSKYKTYISVNKNRNKGEFIDIPVQSLYRIEVWTYSDIDDRREKELRTIGIMTRDFYQVKGRVIKPNGRPLSGVEISSTDNQFKTISNRKGLYKIEDVRENSIIEFARSGYEPYYLATKFTVPYTMDMTIKLNRAKRSGYE